VLANRQQRLSARSETYRKSVITVALSAQGMPLIFDGVETDVWGTTSSAAGLKTGNIITTSLSFDASPISKSHEAERARQSRVSRSLIINPCPPVGSIWLAGSHVSDIVKTANDHRSVVKGRSVDDR